MRCNLLPVVLALSTVLGIAVALSGSVQAAPVVYEPFDYATPGNLVPQSGGVGFSGPWETFGGGRNPLILSGNLDWGSLPTTGNYAQGNAINAPYRPLDSALADNGLLNDGATLWFSYVADMSSQPNMTNLDLNIGLTTETFSSRYPTQTDYNNKVHLINDGQGIGVSMDQGVVRGAYWQDDGDGDSYGERHTSTASLTLGTDEKALIVGKIDWGSTEETLTLYTPNTDLELGTPIISTTTPNLNQAQFDTLAIGWKDTPSIDEIRFGATAEDVLGVDVFEPIIIPVPNGDFAVYKPGTGYTVRGTVPGNIWVQQIGDNRPLSSGTPVDFDDGTSGMVVDIPGWITPRDSQGSPTGTADLFTLGFDSSDGTSTLNAFGAWSGQNGNLAESAAPLDLPANRASLVFELSAMVIGDVGARTFDLLVDGVVLTPDSSVEPSYDGGIWQEMSRTYNGIPAGDVTILVGTARPGPGEPDLFGSRMRVDNISLAAVASTAVPEPSTFFLAALGLLGLAWYARRRRRS